MENIKTPQAVAVGAAGDVKMVDFCIKDESGAIGKEEIKFENEIDSSIAGCLSVRMVGVEDEVKCVKQNEVEKGCLSEGGVVDCEKESDIGIEKIVEKGCKTLDVARDDSTMNIEVSGDGLSLYVDFTNLNDDALDSEIIASENMPKVAEEEMKMVENGDRTYNFTEGDVVWLKIRNQKWWPGKVETESDDERGSLMVEHFGNRNVTMCLPSQLKPFQENFKLLSGNSKSRSFLGAVEKAVDEFGRRIKLEMTCPCAEEANHKEIASFPLNRSSVFAEFSVRNFEPALFLAYLKNIAQGGFGSVIDALELIVLEHRLLAFYGSLGCFQLPLHELCETSDAGDSPPETSSTGADEKEEIKLKSGKRNRINYNQELDYSVDSRCREQNDGSYKKRELGPQSRERKRSKYLSYPYINWGEISTTAESEDSARTISHGSVLVTVDDDYNLVRNDSSSKFWRKWYKRFCTGNDVFDDSELINMSSANFLSELRFIALNCLYPSTNENFVSVGWFFSRFRVSEFHDESTYIGENEDIDAEPCLRTKLDDGKLPSASTFEGTKRKRRSTLKNEGGSNSIPEMEECKSNNIEPSSLLVKDSLGLRTENSRPKRKMTKQRASSVHEQSEQRTSLPDLNGGRGKVERKTRKKKGIALKHSTVTSELSNVNEGSKNGSFFIDLQVMPPAAAARKHEEKLTLRAIVVPDLNGIGIDCSNVIQAQTKLERRNESFSGDQIRDSAPGKPYMDIDGGLDTVLLTFSPGARTPSMEELITTFGKFGPLRESECKFTDSSNALLVFVKADNAGEAIRSVEMNKPFGAAIVKYQLCNHSAPTGFSDDHSSKSSASMEEYMTPANSSDWKPNTEEEESEESESEGDDIKSG